MIHRSMPGGVGIVRTSCVIPKPLASSPWITPINKTGRPLGSPRRYAVMSRPCTDRPMTCVSVTSDEATVVVVDVLVVDVVVTDVVVADVVVVDDVVVDWSVEVVVVDAVVDAAVAAEVAISVAACVPADTDDDASDPDEHANITCDATSSAHDQARFVIVVECSARSDQNTAITVWLLLALDDPANRCQELRDAAHHAVLGPDLGADSFELRTRHQHCGRIDN